MTSRTAVRRTWLLAVVGALTACAHQLRVPSATPTLRVMTYNIQAGGGDLNRIAEVIRASRADLVALQEVDVHWHARSGFADQTATLAERLGMQVRFAPIYRLPGNEPAAATREYGVAVLSRYPVVAFTNHEVTRLSTQVEGAAPALMPGFLEVGIVVQGRHVRVFNTHLDYRGDPGIRRQQVIESVAIIGADDTPVLLFGDLNASPAAPELRGLLVRLSDAWPDTAGAGFTYPASNPVRRIDYVLISRHFRVVSAHVPDAMASDHRPVIVDLRFTARP
jgi:endonuclease/exonuclease/phosphatase family metal-dependent hydrolase